MSDMENGEHFVGEEKISLNDAISNKLVGHWFWMGFLAAILTSFISWNSQQTSGIIKFMSVSYINPTVLGMFLYRKWIGVRFYEKIIRKRDLKIVAALVLLFFFVIGHLMGFVSISLIRTIFKG